MTTSLTDIETTRGTKLSFYHATNCGPETCEFFRAGDITPGTLNTTYVLDFPVMNTNDRLIMDTRNTGWMKIIDLKFTSGGVEYNLLDFTVAESDPSTTLGSFYTRHQIVGNDGPCGFRYQSRLSECLS